MNKDTPKRSSLEFQDHHPTAILLNVPVSFWITEFCRHQLDFTWFAMETHAVTFLYLITRLVFESHPRRSEPLLIAARGADFSRPYLSHMLIPGPQVISHEAGQNRVRLYFYAERPDRIGAWSPPE
jgi:hypothetical protein